jgi:hypothetical protein
LRWVAWKAATRVDFSKAGRSCWASGRRTAALAAVENMRWEAAGPCLRMLERAREAIAGDVRVRWNGEGRTGTSTMHGTEVDGLDRWPIRRTLMSDGPTLVVRGHVGSDARKLNLAIPA